MKEIKVEEFRIAIIWSWALCTPWCFSFSFSVKYSDFQISFVLLKLEVDCILMDDASLLQVTSVET
jgi:hypothetical protein